MTGKGGIQIRALDNPTYVQLLMSVDNLTLLLIGTEYQGPDSLRVSDTGIDPLNRYRQLDLAQLMGRACWKKGYYYTIPPTITQRGSTLESIAPQNKPPFTSGFVLRNFSRN